MTNSEPLLSVVVVSRNDDHGGNLLERMQLFVSGWLEQAKRHNFRSELVIVEWNPLPDRESLTRALKWPEESGPCAVRIITIPPELHQRFKYADRLPLFQMIGKNVGIRRARGRFILATNIDILFSDELVQYFNSGKLTKGSMYRIDRYDVPSDVPADAPVSEQLEYCRENVIRINSRGKTTILNEPEQPHEESVSLFRSFFRRLRAIKNIKDIFRLLKQVCIAVLVIFILRPAYRIIYLKIIRPIIYGKTLHTNACGDFTMMAREHWLELRGNAEFETFSLHLDSLMCAVAHYGGAKEEVLPDPMRIYHIEHAPGSGWSPGVGAKLLDERLKTAGISQLTYPEVLKYIRQIRWRRGPTIFNEDDWGLGDVTFAEEVVVKADWDTA